MTPRAGAIRTAAFVLALMPAAAVAWAEGPAFTAPAAASPIFERRDVESIVRSLADVMAGDYVDSTRGARVKQKLLAGLRAKRYPHPTPAAPLIDRLVADVQEVIHDAHFNMIYSPPAATGFSWVSAGEGPLDEKALLEEARVRLRPGNFGVVQAEVREGNIGYLRLSRFDAPLELFRGPLAAAFTLLQNTDALLIDLRKNPGGNTECVQLAYSYLADGPAVLSTSEFTRRDGVRQEYRTTEDPGGPRYLGRPVYVLAGPATGSGAEMFTYQVKTRGKGTIVGATTSGAAHSFDSFRIGEERLGHVMVLVPNARMVDAFTRADWESVGVAPDVEAPVKDAPLVATRLALEALMAKATEPAQQEAYRNLIAKTEFVRAHGVPDVAELARYAGRYGIRTISLLGDGLQFQRDNGPPVDLTRVGEHEFELDIAMNPKPRLRFEVEGTAATAMWLDGLAGKQRIPRDP